MDEIAAWAGPVLEAEELYRFFRSGEEETLALRGVSLSVAAGEIVAVVGPSGSGKSTLLACLAGLDEPAGGTVRILGQRINSRPETERAALRAKHIGVLFQSENLFAHLTVTQNVQLIRRLSDTTSIEAAVLLESLGLGDRAGAYPGELSGGETARAGLAVALANGPELLLADEPTGELDAETGRRLLALLRRHADRGCAILLVTHSRDVVAAADRVIRMSDGRIDNEVLEEAS
ncbi:ABC transporter ATP-binding protein [Paenarthrobacter sp. Z7-10]|uniref:ABC transporter ATP-binding protein n=1 Tax=Paenarthrobacter sp. Z7-10 TaxID=2787635 RepID=UPI0022A9A49D|nr:ABC transporter ATP-binding protein [Paenarthrobacter sp. Z7-10]MCZ2403985.1 ABC transporter ATP-binding protein [Paenarthrobacter sp. Z7-10]